MKLPTLLVSLTLLAINAEALVARVPNPASSVDECLSSASALFKSAGGIDGFADEESFAAAVQADPDLCTLIQDMITPPKESREIQARSDSSSDDGPPRGAGWKDSYGYWHPGLNPELWVYVTYGCANCLKNCLRDNHRIHWRPGLIFDFNMWTSLTACTMQCTFEQKCTSRGAGTWAARQRTDNVQMS